MNFANFSAGYWALLALPVVIGFLIRRYRRRRTVSSDVIYRRIQGFMISKRRFAVPQHLVALLLVLLALAALVLAAMDPKGAEITPRKYVVLFDTSASMTTVDLGQTQSRFERGREALSEFILTLNPADEVALITAGAGLSLDVGWTTAREEVLSSLYGMTPLGGRAGLADGFEVANAMCQQPEITEILLVSDGAHLPIPQLDCPLRYVRMGAEAGNVGVVGLTVREADAFGLNEIYYSVQNATSEETDIYVGFYIDNVRIDVVTETVAAGGIQERLIRLALPQGVDILEARIETDGENALEADDRAYAVLRPGARVNALLVTEYPTTFTAEALRLHPRVDLTVIAPAELTTGPLTEDGTPRLPTPPPETPYDLVVFDTTVDEVAPAWRHVVLLDVGQSWLGAETTGAVVQPPIIRWDFDHPLFRFVAFEDVRIARATATELPPDALSLMDMPDGPLIFTANRGGQEILYFTFHPDLSDLPLRVSFVNLMANLVEWSQPGIGDRLRSRLTTGARLEEVPPGSELDLRTSLDWRSDSVVAMQMFETLQTDLAADSDDGVEDAQPPLLFEGVYAVRTPDQSEEALVAVNLFSPEESEVTSPALLGVGAMSGWPEVFKTEAFPWWMLVAAALGLLALEWILPGLLAASWRIARWQKRRSNRRQAEGPALKSTQTTPRAV